MTGALAARWARSVVPSWTYRWLLPVCWLGAILASTIGDTGPCSVEDPTVCGPDTTFSLALVVCFAALALLWWQPIVAALAGLLFMALDLRYDDVTSARVAWGIYGVLCALLLIWIFLSRRSQRSLSTRMPRNKVQVPPAAPLGVTIWLLVAAGLVLLGAAGLGVMAALDHREEAHLRRAVEQIAVVQGLDDDGEVVLKLPNGTTRHVLTMDDYATGAQVPVLVDPADPHWLRLRAEPADNTYWYSLAGAAWTVAFLIVLRDLRVRRARPRRAWSGSAMPVRIDRHYSDAFTVRSADGTVLLGFIHTAPDDLFPAHSGGPAKLRQEWAKTLRRYRGEALLIGDLAEGSWPTLMIGSQVLRPTSPFRAPRKLPWHNETASRLPKDFQPPEDAPAPPPIEPAREVPTLPWEVPLRARSWWSMPVLVAVLLVVPLAVGAFATWGEWLGAFMATLVGAQLVHVLATRALFRLTATATDLWIRTGWLDQCLSWRSVDTVEVDEDGLSLAAGDSWHVLGGIADKDLPRVAAVFETLRLRSHTGLSETPPARRFSPVLLIDAAYLAICVLILVLTRWNPF